MITKLSTAITKILLKRSIVSADDEELYVYGFFMILSYLIFFCFDLLIGFVLKIPVEAMVFYVIFCALRNYAGGIHANTEWKCTILTTLSIIASLVLIKLLVTYNLIIISSVMMFLSCVCLLAFAPLSNSQKEIDENERLRFRKKTILWTIGAMVVVILAFIFQLMFNIGIAVLVGMFLSAILLFLGILKKYFGGNKNKEVNE